MPHDTHTAQFANIGFLFSTQISLKSTIFPRSLITNKERLTEQQLMRYFRKAAAGELCGLHEGAGAAPHWFQKVLAGPEQGPAPQRGFWGGSWKKGQRGAGQHRVRGKG